MQNIINHPARIVMAALFALTAISTSFAADMNKAEGEVNTKIYTGWLSDVAISGYDPVAYFTEGKPTKGKDDFSYEWADATWKFASSGNRDLFAANPSKYAPQYGGHCAWAIAAKDDLVKVNPKYWAIVDDKLYLNYSAGVQEDWNKDRSGFIVSGDSNWSGKGYSQ